MCPTVICQQRYSKNGLGMLGSQSKELPSVLLPKYQLAAATSLGIGSCHSRSCLWGASNSLRPQNPTEVKGRKGKLPPNLSDEYMFQNIDNVLSDQVSEHYGDM